MLVEKPGFPTWTLTPHAIISWPFEDAPQEFRSLCKRKGEFVTYIPSIFVEKMFAIKGDPTQKAGLYIVKYSNGDYIVFES